VSERDRAARAAPYVVVGAIAGYFYYVAAHIQYSARAGTLGPDFWPKLLLGLMIAVCAYEVVKIFVLGRSVQVGGVLETLVERSADLGLPTEPADTRRRPALLLAGIGLTAAYVTLVQTLGFFTATVPYLAAFIVLGGYRRWGVIAIVSLAGTLAMVFFFMKVVYVSLPLGTGPFQQVTLALMQLLGIR
jgi:putative tricarboxylic transport membrane protein